MAKTNRSNSRESRSTISWPPKPNRALKRLDKLVGTWRLKGRTFDSKGDNITGKVTMYTGTFSKYGQTLSGGWRPDKGGEVTGETSYDAIMTRVNGR